MTPQELKNSILQLAIQGKLVEQRPEEGTGAELLEKILAAKSVEDAKKNLTRSRGVRGGCNEGELFNLPEASKSHPEKFSALSASPRDKIPDDEKPFDIPESWEWVRLGDCTSYAAKKEKVLSTDIRPDEWSLDLEDIEKDTGRIIEFRSAKDRRIVGEKVVFHKGQILYSKLRPYLKKILVAPKDGICTPELVPFSALGGIDANYLVDILMSPHVDFAINSVTYGVKMPRVGTDTMVNLLIPLPPLAEQKRIVAKIEELLPLVDRYEKAWSRLEDFNKRFPIDMQKSLLQMAIQGKLVEQREDEGTGTELLEKIFAVKDAKKNLTRSRGVRGGCEEGELFNLPKAAKSHPEKFSALSASPRDKIPDDEKPFEIPESWEWVRLGEVVDVRDGTHDTPKYVQAGVPLVTSKNLVSGTIDFTTAKFISYKDSEAINIRSGVDDGDVLFAMIGTIGNPVLIRKDREFSIKNMALFKPIDRGLFCMEYLMMFLTKAQLDMRKSASASVQSFVSLSFLRNYPIPLPPLAEQKRIVAKLEKLLPLCGRLK